MIKYLLLCIFSAIFLIQPVNAEVDAEGHCTEDADCPGTYCQSDPEALTTFADKYCAIKKLENGETCSKDIECQSEKCFSSGIKNLCALPCTNDADCPGTYCISLNPSNTYCAIKKLENDEKCKEDNQCKSGKCLFLGADPNLGTKIYKCASPAPSTPIKNWAPIAPTIEIKIPTLQPFTTAGMEQPDAEGNIYIPFIGQYIVGIYKWAVLVAGIIATIMIILGGFTYFTSGGDATRAGQGKERITSAIFGLILLLGSYLLLYLLNPDLVQFKSLKIKVIEREDLAINPEIMKDPIDSPPCTGPNSPSKPSGIGDITYLGQLDNLACGTRDLSKIKYIVIHEGGKSTASTVNIFKQRQVSSHYSIDRDGKIFILVGEEKRARHAGPTNAYSIGIDLSHAQDCPGAGPSPKCAYTDEMIASLNKLINSIANRTGIGIVKSDQSVIGHCQVEGTTHTDPRNLDWSKLGLNNAAHYEDGNNLASKCKIIFNAATAQQAKQATKQSSGLTGCCTLPGDTTMSDTFEQDCTNLFGGTKWDQGNCPNP